MSSSFAHRPALDGIRAVAVIAVIVYHLDGDWLPGGFLGVDIFFVMSGFLITSLLIRERSGTGRVDLAAFWSRRARRLLPAMLLMVAGVTVYYALFTSELERLGLRGDLIATLFYVSNWRFISSGQSYFEQYVDGSPVRHTWSLAIEEQFYLVWPVVVALVLRRRSLRTLGLVAGVGVVASVVAFAALYDVADPSRAYYGSGARVHQMLIGVALAVLLSGRHAENTRRFGRRFAPWSAAMLVIAFVLLDDQSPIYYRGGSVAVALMAAIVIAGFEGGHPLRGPMAWRPLVAVGTVSYGLYLWHWPVITVIASRYGDVSSLRWSTMAIAVTSALTIASYVFVERPVRRRSSIFGQALKPRTVLIAVPALTLVTSGIVVASTAGVTQPEWARQSDAPGILREPRPVGEGSAGAEPVVAVIGDSVMVSLLPGLRDASIDRGFELIEAAVAACPVGYQPLFDNEGVVSPYAERCAEQVAAAHDMVVSAEPDIVIWHDLQSVLARRDAAGELLVSGTDEWEASLMQEWSTVLDRMVGVGAEVVLLMPPLRSMDLPEDCAADSRCATIQEQDRVIRAVTERWWAQVGDRPGVVTVRADDVLCGDGYPCPSNLDGVLVRLDGSDQTHFTEHGARWFTDQVAPLLRLP
jgi:peptidoglycan/LPS O-acetylase OafA/YrhL